MALFLKKKKKNHVLPHKSQLYAYINSNYVAYKKTLKCIFTKQKKEIFTTNTDIFLFQLTFTRHFCKK